MGGILFVFCLVVPSGVSTRTAFGGCGVGMRYSRGLGFPANDTALPRTALSWIRFKLSNEYIADFSTASVTRSHGYDARRALVAWRNAQYSGPYRASWFRHAFAGW